MTHSSALLDEVVSQVTHRAVQSAHGTNAIPLINAETGEPDGLLLQSLLERVAIFVRAQDVLSLADVSGLRRAMTRAQARRAYVYVLASTNVQKPVLLLATLSKIRLIRVEAPTFMS